jgi:signal transduction histidine kinase
MLRRLSRSLSFRLLGIFLVLAALFIWGTLGVLRWVYNNEEIRGLVSGHLSLHVSYVKDDIGSPPRIDRALSITRRVPVDIRIYGPDVDWASDADFPRVEELEFGPSAFFSSDPDALVDELTGVEFAEQERHSFLKIKQGEYDIVVVSPRIADQASGPNPVLLILGLGLFYLMLGYAAVSWLFKPIRAIRTGAAAIGRGNFSQRIEDVRSDQLGDLAADINKLASDVESMLDAKRALLLGVSHELRTPLSRMNLVLEMLDDEQARESMKSEVVEMDKIIVSLLEAERLSTRHEPLSRSRVSVAKLIDELIADYFERDRDRLRVDNRAGEIEVDIDEARIKLLLKNLLGNALRYSAPDSGPVTLDVHAGEGELVLRVSDHGPGLTRKQARHLGEPFYRSDPSRTRDTGGTGLGLYLATLVATAHGGTIELLNPGQPGAQFECRIPVEL